MPIDEPIMAVGTGQPALVESPPPAPPVVQIGNAVPADDPDIRPCICGSVDLSIVRDESAGWNYVVCNACATRGPYDRIGAGWDGWNFVMRGEDPPADPGQ